MIELAKTMGVVVDERPFTVAEAKAAKEAIASSTSAFVTPVVRIDDTAIGDGAPGETTKALRAAFLARADAITRETAWA